MSPEAIPEPGRHSVHFSIIILSIIVDVLRVMSLVFPFRAFCTRNQVTPELDLRMVGGTGTKAAADLANKRVLWPRGHTWELEKRMLARYACGYKVLGCFYPMSLLFG
jgi:hypothetical protein